MCVGHTIHLWFPSLVQTPLFPRFICHPVPFSFCCCSHLPLGLDTCCPRPGGYGCCPDAEGVCCADQKTCCESGYSCNTTSGRCDANNKTEHPLITFMPYYDLCNMPAGNQTLQQIPNITGDGKRSYRYYTSPKPLGLLCPGTKSNGLHCIVIRNR